MKNNKESTTTKKPKTWLEIEMKKTEKKYCKSFVDMVLSGNPTKTNHTYRVLTQKEIEATRSSAYTFIL